MITRLILVKGTARTSQGWVCTALIMVRAEQASHVYFFLSQVAVCVHTITNGFSDRAAQGPRSNVGTLMSTVSTLGVLTLALILLLAQCANTF